MRDRRRGRMRKAKRGGNVRDISKSFGRETVAPEDRRHRIRTLFNAIAPRYDLMNDLMSGGTHRFWKRSFVAQAMTAAGAGGNSGPWLDLAAGTGDIAQRISARRPRAHVILCDPSHAMLSVARERGNGAAVAGEGERLPFADASFAAVTLSFGLRNATDPALVLGEALRVLRPGGRLFILEFSQPLWWFAPAYRLYSRLVIPALGALVARHRGAYRYLVDSIAGFPDVEVVSGWLTDAGFAAVKGRRLFFGIAAIHEAAKATG